MKYYAIDEIMLKDLLINDIKLAALESGGVDNWEWYGESISDYLKLEKVEDFEELAKREIARMELKEVNQ